jgi:hypothetical protein
MGETFILNGFVVDARISALMSRPDWAGNRTSAAWLERFPTHTENSGPIPFVQFCSPTHAIRENQSVRDPGLTALLGHPNLSAPPGDFDPTAGYIIGFTDYVDAAIIVDLREGGRIIYNNLFSGRTHYAVAFGSIENFVEFYLMQHDPRQLTRSQ